MSYCSPICELTTACGSVPIPGTTEFTAVINLSCTEYASRSFVFNSSTTLWSTVSSAPRSLGQEPRMLNSVIACGIISYHFRYRRIQPRRRYVTPCLSAPNLELWESNPSQLNFCPDALSRGCALSILHFRHLPQTTKKRPRYSRRERVAPLSSSQTRLRNRPVPVRRAV